jgi:beta-phosphoglucomutase-like phosphatase (HAD superfamily)
MNSLPEALVFDFDGVIADTEPLYWRAWCELLKRGFSDSGHLRRGDPS